MRTWSTLARIDAMLRDEDRVSGSLPIGSETRCPVCVSPSRVWTDINGFSLSHCPGCGCRFVWPQPSAEELEKIYSGEYFDGTNEGWGFASYEALAPSLRRMFRAHLGRIARFAPGTGRLLDVGCAYGFFLAEAKAAGWDVSGVEISPEAAAKASELTGAPVFAGTLAQAASSLEEGSFDVVTFWDTLEHVSDPVADLSLANAMLREGGSVFLTVPKAWGPLPAIMGRTWFGYKKAGEHLFFHTRKSLAEALERAGFVPLMIRRVSWTCNVGFLAGKLAYYSPGLSRFVTKVVKVLRLDGVPVAFPWINAFVAGRKVRSAELDPPGSEPSHL